MDYCLPCIPLLVARAVRVPDHQDVPARPADPLPPWLGSPFSKAGIIVEPDPGDPRLSRVFNPTAIVVRDDASGKDKVVMFFRAEDGTGAGVYDGTSRIFRAESLDGIHFSEPELVLEPTEPYETEPHPGGCEDPRVVRLEDGRYLMTYTAFDGKTARLALAVSDDMKTWEETDWDVDVSVRAGIELNNRPHTTGHFQFLLELFLNKKHC